MLSDNHQLAKVLVIQLLGQFNMKSKIFMTLVWITKKDEILLGLKKRGLGVGLWNGFGGKVEVGESIVSAAKR